MDDLETYLSKIRLTVAPLRYGAGVKGKVGNSLRMGVPVVATRTAAEGMGLVHGEHVLVADNVAGFAEAVSNLYSDEEQWERLSVQGQQHVQELFGVNSAKRKLEDLVRSLV